MAEGTVLQANPRTVVGKQAAKGLRRQGLLPAVVYGEKGDAVACSVDQKAFMTILHEKGHNAIIDLVVDGVGDHAAIIKEIQHDPVRRQVLHVDFHRISLTTKIVVGVPVEAAGSPVGVRNEGGILEHLLYEVEVECLPTSIPEQIAHDVTSMAIHDTVHVSDLIVDGNVRIVTEKDRPVFMVIPPSVRKEEEEAEEEEGLIEGEETQEPEVIERGKREEEGEPEEG